MKKVVILGANGFLGRILTESLHNNGFLVVPVVRNNLDLTDFSAVKKFLYNIKPYAVINCTIPGGRNKIDNLDQNDVDIHLKIFLNFFNNAQYFEKFFSIGSGAEFDRNVDINQAHETDILIRNPIDNYGYLKNTVARISMGHEKFYNLRIFGCFDSSESPDRLFKRVFTSPSVVVDDRYFDFISAKDFCTIVNYYLNNKVIYRDVNCVYAQKKKISSILDDFIFTFNLKTQIIITEGPKLNYTGNSGRLDVLGLPLDGIIKSIENYK